MTNEELKETSKHLNYEIWMFEEMSKLIKDEEFFILDNISVSTTQGIPKENN